MSGEHDLAPEQRAIRNPEVTFDETDLNARAVVLFLIYLAIGGFLIAFMTWGAYKYMAGSYLASQPTTNPLATSRRELAPIGGDPASAFPAPRLQPEPVADYNKFAAREDQILNSYGWVDQANGKVHIPIERAIDLLATSGLPVRPAETNSRRNTETKGKK